MAATRTLILLAISVSIATVQAGFQCDFESGMCGYYQGTGDEFDWARQNGSTTTGDTGPDVDHTYGTSLGNYLYAEASSQQTGDKTLIYSPSESANTPKCVQFYYYMLGEHMGSLKVYARDNASTNLGTAVWEKTGEQGRQWLRGLVTVPRIYMKYADIIFEAKMGSGVRSDIAIDDIEVINTNGYCPLDSFTCNFDTGMCNVVQDTTDDFNFIRKMGSTSTFQTGPSEDHTTGKGYYVYIESSFLTKGKKARLIMPQFRGVQANDKETFCVVFWYHMYGTAVGELNVYLRNASSTGLGSPIWWIGGNRGNVWRAGEVELNTPEDFNVYFEAVRGQTISSDIALDDVNITSYACPGHHIINNVSSVSCDFEEAEICYYRQDDTDNFNWNWINRGTMDWFTGPVADHTRGDELGFFVYITGTYRLSPRDKARLISPMTKSNSKTSCVEFWYHMYGRDVETLNIYIKPDTGSLPSTPAWNLTGDQGNYWHYASLSIPANSGDYRIVFEASPGSKNRDDVAIDDVALFEGADCPPFVTLPPPSTTPPPLADNIDCDFEIDYCNYTQMIQGDQLDWNRYQGTGPGPFRTYGPDKDHTKGDLEGFYASMDPYPYIGATLDDKAILISPLLRASSQPRCVTFWAFMYGYSMDYLNLYIRPYGTTRSIDASFSEYGNHAKAWFYLEMNIPASADNIQVLFEGVCGRSRFSSELAVDDIVLQDEKCLSSTVTPQPVPWGANCDFEQDGSLCGYTHYQYGDFDWARQSGETGSDMTGPSFDHTMGNGQGHYMYIETSLPQRPGNDATLITPVLNSKGDDICLRFYYHAYGDDTGLFAIKLKMVDFNTVSLLFSLSGDQGDEWRPANINLPSRIIGFADFQVLFEGRKGIGFLGDIAIDDIVFLRRPCEGFPTDSQCTFEQGVDFCGFRIELGPKSVGWKWYDVLATEPPPLNSEISSSYLYTKGLGAATAGKKSTIYTETHDLLGIDHCFTADFVVSADSNQKIKIEAVEEPSTTFVAPMRYDIGTLSGDMGKNWFRGNWSMPSKMTRQPFKLVFTATMGSAGIMAIDNVIFTPRLEACAKYVAPPTRSPTTTTKSPPPTAQRQTTTPPTTTRPQTTIPMTTKGDDITRQPRTGPNAGTTIGIIVAVIIVVVIVVVTVVVCKYRPMLRQRFNISYKSEKLDEIPFSGVTANPAVIISSDPKPGDDL